MPFPVIRYQVSSISIANGAMALVLAFAPLAFAQDSSRVVQRSYVVADESSVIYDIVASATLGVLPEALQQELLELQNAIRVAGRASLWDKTNKAVTNRRADEHYLILDAAAFGAGTLDSEFAKKLAAVQAFPKDRRAARKLFQQMALRKGGVLPWVLLDHYAALKAAFELQQTDAVVQEIAAVVHYSADVAMAFHVTGNGFAAVLVKETSSSSQKSMNTQAAATWWQGQPLYQRCQVELIAWSRDRFEHETRVWPGRIKPISDPIEVIFEAMRQAYGIGHELSALDRKICASLVIQDERDFSQRGDAYYLAMSERAGHLLRLQLEAGTLLAARLVVDAWQRTGRLSLSQPALATDHPIPAKIENSSVEADTLVGSKSSHVFHRSSCPHAKRIASENLVPFSSAQSATNQGRRPCRTCQPK